MLYLEIIPEFRRHLRTEESSQASKPLSLLGETPRECFERHRGRCVFKVGDIVSFKKPKRNPRIKGSVIYIEEDLDKVTWSKEGLAPMYIQVAVEINGKLMQMKTHEGKLQYCGRPQ